LAGTAGVFWPPGDNDPILRGDDVEPLRTILADHVHRAATTGAGRLLGLDDDLDPRQMFG
jgi:hypothetical protein